MHYLIYVRENEKIMFFSNALKATFLCVIFFLGACSHKSPETEKGVSVQKYMSKTESNNNDSYPTSVKFAQFNVSFAHDGDPSENYEQWLSFMSIEAERQDALIERWRANTLSGSEKSLAERIMQIRNIAAIIQAVRPDVLLLNEFNNDGTGTDYGALEGFQKNYLAHAQSLNSVDGGELQKPISYPFMQNYATNTGLPSGMDLHNTGYDENDPNDAYGFGFYHGHYAFALMSKYEIDTDNTRTFQTFKRKDLPDAVMPTINVCDGSRELPEGMKCGDPWFSASEWENVRLSSKNHVDAPIIIPQKNGNTIIHAFLSHPTPPAFDTVTDNNKYRNSEENAFWLYYINGAGNDPQTVISAQIYDDNGNIGGFSGDSFVVMGDLNADAQIRTGKDPRFNGIQRLMSSPLVNQSVAQADGAFVPASLGGAQASLRRPHPFPNTRTSTFGARADYSVPSANLKVLDSGVYWQGEDESGRLLFNDHRIGERGTDKEISSDHRLVWVSIQLAN